MHPKNIYKDKMPDLSFLRKSQSETNGVDWKNASTLRTITKKLLKTDFQVDIEIPSNRLCPPVPNRLNYICWLSDLIQTFELTPSSIHILDIGVGASCIFPILGHQQFSWKFTGTDVDSYNINYAQKNVTMNNLSDEIKLFLVDGSHECQQLLLLVLEHYFGQKFNNSNRKVVKETLFDKSADNTPIPKKARREIVESSSILIDHNNISNYLDSNNLELHHDPEVLFEGKDIEIIRHINRKRFQSQDPSFYFVTSLLRHDCNGRPYRGPLRQSLIKMGFETEIYQLEKVVAEYLSTLLFSESIMEGNVELHHPSSLQHEQNAAVDVDMAVDKCLIPDITSTASKLINYLKIGKESMWLTATMCNPPFYELGETALPSQHTVCTGDDVEMYTAGGEIAFISAMIFDTLLLGGRIGWYSSMIGHKHSLKILLRLLRILGIKNSRSTRFVQGRTMRWALAWTFRQDCPPSMNNGDKLFLKKIPALTETQIQISLPLRQLLLTCLPTELSPLMYESNSPHSCCSEIDHYYKVLDCRIRKAFDDHNSISNSNLRIMLSETIFNFDSQEEDANESEEDDIDVDTVSITSIAEELEKGNNTCSSSSSSLSAFTDVENISFNISSNTLPLDSTYDTVVSNISLHHDDADITVNRGIINSRNRITGVAFLNSSIFSTPTTNHTLPDYPMSNLKSYFQFEINYGIKSSSEPQRCHVAAAELRIPPPTSDVSLIEERMGFDINIRMVPEERSSWSSLLGISSQPPLSTTTSPHHDKEITTSAINYALHSAEQVKITIFI